MWSGPRQKKNQKKKQLLSSSSGPFIFTQMTDRELIILHFTEPDVFVYFLKQLIMSFNSPEPHLP